jgi:hypothetical protein
LVATKKHDNNNISTTTTMITEMKKKTLTLSKDKEVITSTASTSTTSTSTLTSTSTYNKAQPPLEVYSGKPTEKLSNEYNDGSDCSWLSSDGGSGWTKKMMKRMNGKNIGRVDSYWYTPKMKYRLRSIVEVKLFMKALQYYEGNEILANENYRKMNTI